MTTNNLLHGDVSDRILRAFHRVHNRLDFGFAEPVYRDSIAMEFADLGLTFQREPGITVYYREHAVGFYRPDFVVEGVIVVEVKCHPSIRVIDERQLYNYLRCTCCSVGLLLNFGHKPEHKRLVCTLRPIVVPMPYSPNTGS